MLRWAASAEPPEICRSEPVTSYLFLGSLRICQHCAAGSYRQSQPVKDSTPTQITYAISGSPLGRLLVAATARGICMVSAGDSDRALERKIRDQFPKADVVRDDTAMKKHVAAVARLVDGKAGARSLPLDLQGTAFQKKVWAELLRIPSGVTRSYGEIARRINHPTAYRAVAQACGANPVAVVIPCHRVVSGDGSIGGYGLGLDRKRALLENEGHENPRWGITG